MYWGQVLLSLVLAASGAYAAYTRGQTDLEALLLGIIFYFLIRWLLAWIHRIRYWYERGTSGVYTLYCPTCARHRNRISGDWMLTCRKCGWKPGRFGTRWLTKSLPAQQLRRTVGGPQLLVVVVLSGVLVSGAASGVALQDIAPQDQQIIEGISPDQPAEVSAAELTPTATLAESDTPRDDRAAEQENTNTGLDLRAAEQEILTRTNRIRSDQGLSNVSWSSFLHERALRHSQDMAEYDYYSHEGPNGESSDSRLRQISNQCGGAASENIHRGEVRTEMYIYDTSETVYMDDPQSIARYGVQGWMNSPGHRENMVGERWTHAGVGLHTTDDGDIFMTIIFC